MNDASEGNRLANGRMDDPAVESARSATSSGSGESIGLTGGSGELPLGALVSRSLFGGVLMGLANLVPGISGGTMLLAAGVYPDFIAAISNITRFRFLFRSILVLGCVVLAAGVGILSLAGVMKDWVIHQRWIMYSLFIGLTLGAVPIVWKRARPANNALRAGAMAAFLVMVGLALLQAGGYVGQSHSNFFMLFVAGLAGASAMILPGVSGGYLLLLLGQYVPILGGIDQFKDALRARDVAAGWEPAVSVVLPVGLGVVVGVVVVSNALQWLMKNRQHATMGVLLGLLVGSVVGLWPFQQGVRPQVGDVVKGSIVTPERLDTIDPEDWPTEFFRPRPGQIASGLVLVAVGFLLTQGVERMGGKKDQVHAEARAGRVERTGEG